MSIDNHPNLHAVGLMCGYGGKLYRRLCVEQEMKDPVIVKCRGGQNRIELSRLSGGGISVLLRTVLDKEYACSDEGAVLLSHTAVCELIVELAKLLQDM